MLVSARDQRASGIPPSLNASDVQEVKSGLSSLSTIKLELKVGSALQGPRSSQTSARASQKCTER